MIDQVIGEKCTACTACESACPRNAISMAMDREGFFYPKVDNQTCISCGLCKTVCPVFPMTKDLKKQMPEVYAAWNKDEYTRLNSTSGGVFSALAKVFIDRGGYVAGAVYGEHFEIYHELCHYEKDIERLRQSKYAQSDLKAVFKEIKETLAQGLPVLFCGTPCQSAGLQSFLGDRYENLYCCDFICRGVISQKVYQKYLSDVSNERRELLTRVHFKNKDYGWNRFSTKLSYENGEYYQKDRNEDPYMRGYLRHNLYLRPSCYECCFKELPRVSDVSLGDFWGVGTYKSELDTDKGTSAVLVNTEKGKKLFSAAKEMLITDPSSIEIVLAGNVCLLHAPSVGKYRDYFFENYDSVPFEDLIYKIDDLTLGLSKKDKVLKWMKRTKDNMLSWVK